jgi:CBS domain-containing protein
MGREFLCVRDDMSLEAVRALFLERGLSGAPVVNAEGAPVGVVTKTDLVRALGELEPEEAGETLPYGFHMERLPRAIVVEVMTPFVHTLPMRSSVAEAAAFMARHELHHVIVVDPKGTVVGVLTTLDLARWLAAQTGYVTTPPDRH